MQELSDKTESLRQALRGRQMTLLGRAGIGLMVAGALTLSAGFLMTEGAAGSTDGGGAGLSFGILPPRAPIDPTSTPVPTGTPQPTATPEPPTATPEPPTATPEPPTPAPARPAPRPTSPPQPAPPAAPAVSLSPMEQELYNLHNVARANAGLGGLRLDPVLEAIAQRRAQDMASKNYFAHVSPTGETAFTIMDAYGYTYSIAGENIARNNYPNDQASSTAMNGFMNSPSHRENILDSRFNSVGVAVVFGADNMKFFAVVFAGH